MRDRRRPPKVLFDTNVLIDFLLDRKPFVDAAADLLSRAERGEIHGLACADSFTTIFYLARKAVGVEKAKEHIASLLSLLDVAQVNRPTLERASESDMIDFEDAVVVESGRQAGAAYIVTRDARDFRGSSVPVRSPGGMIRMLRVI